MKLESLALHHGYKSDPTTHAAAVPIYQTTSYTFDDTQHGADLFDLKVMGNIYTRIMNPTQDVLEQRIAAMEGGIAALATSSGMAAITYAVQCLTRAGDNIVSTSELYGGTYNLFAHGLPNQGIEVRMASGNDIDAMEALIDDRTKLIFCESIGNPLGNVVDLAALGEIGRKHGVPVVVDNTVPTPYLCRPIDHGCDIVIHSLTKYIGGHGTTIGGVIVDSGRFDWAAQKRQVPDAERTRSVIPWRGLHRGARTRGVYWSMPGRAAAQYGVGDLSSQCFPGHAGSRNPGACASNGIARTPPRWPTISPAHDPRRLGELRCPAGPQAP